MTAAELLRKAERAVASARLLLERADVEGACNRAYYAMFDAARAALIQAGCGAAVQTKSHCGLIAAFGLQLVKTGRIATDLGRAFNKVFEIRQIADYTAEEVSAEQAGRSSRPTDRRRIYPPESWALQRGRGIERGRLAQMPVMLSSGRVPVAVRSDRASIGPAGCF